MKELKINYFKTKNQDRLKFVQVLNSYTKVGLKKSKLLLDQMLDGNPINIQIENDLFESFITELDNLDIKYDSPV